VISDRINPRGRNEKSQRGNLVCKREGKIPLGRPKHRLYEYIKIYLPWAVIMWLNSCVSIEEQEAGSGTYDYRS